MRRFVCLITVVSPLLNVCCGECLQRNKPGDLRFTSTMATWDFAYLGRYKVIDCCATGYDRILWYHKKKGNDTWNLFPFFMKPDTKPRLEQEYQNQTLLILSAGYDVAGTFKCVASNFTNKKELTSKISVDIQDSIARDKVIPQKPPDYACIENSSVVLSCSADFGSADPTETDISWFYLDAPSHLIISERTWSRYENTVEGNTLTIRNLTEQDSGLMFQCQIISIMDDDVLTYNTTLKANRYCNTENVPVNWKQALYMVLLSVVASISFILIIIIILILCRHRIYVVVQRKFPTLYDCCGYRDTIRLENDKMYHAFIYYCEDDIEIATRLFNDIQRAHGGYRLCVASDAPAGPRLQSIGNLVSQAAKFIIVHPVKNVTDASIERFLRDVNAILGDHFLDQKNSVTVIYPDTMWRFKPVKELKGFHHVTGKSDCWWKWSNLPQILLRLPLPVTDENKKSTERKPETYSLIKDNNGFASLPL